ncbi:MAG: hypothetical protein ACT4NL_03935 [Pseudomarimonas sp.]
MSAAIIIVLVVVLKVILSILSSRKSNTATATTSRQDCDEEDDWEPDVKRGVWFDEETGKTGNLPSEQYGPYAGSKSAFED